MIMANSYIGMNGYESPENRAARIARENQAAQAEREER
jgi:hypothetical protein